MSAFLVGILAAVSVSVFAYSKLVRMNGDINVKSNAIGAGIIGLVVFLVVFTLYGRLAG